MTAKASARDFENAIKLYVRGESIQSLASRFGTSQQRLGDELKARGLFRDKAARYTISREKGSATMIKKTALPEREIIRRYLRGESENALAREFGVARHVIGLRLKKARIVRRNNAEANSLMMAERTPEEHLRNTAAAHVATAQREQTFEEKVKRAKTRQERCTHTSPAELKFVKLLQQRGVTDCVPQLAIGPYNADIGAASVAVEIFGGYWHAYGDHARLAESRLTYILDQGWNLIIIWLDGRRHGFGVKAADYVAAFIEKARRDPSIRRQYRVIRGDGHEFPTDKLQIKDLTFIPSRARSANAGSTN